MAKTLKEAIGNEDSNKVRIGYSDLQGYQAALDAMKKSQVVKVVGKVNQATKGIFSTNVSSEVDLTGTVKDGFISEDNLKQMWLKLEAFGGVPIEIEEDVCIASPANTQGNTVWSGGKLNSKFQICPASAVKSDFNGEYSVGVIFDVSNKGKEYLSHFYPNDTMTADSQGNGTPSLQDYIMKGQLWAEIVVPVGSSATSGIVFNAKVIGSTDGSAQDTIYVNSPICLLDVFSKIFPKKEVQGVTEFKGLFTSGYSAYNGKIEGLKGEAISARLKESNKGSVKTISIESSCPEGCRVRLWIDNDAIVQGVPKEMATRNYASSSVDVSVMSSVGMPEPQLGTNPEGHVDVMLDPGHTYIGMRELPKTFNVDWTSTNDQFGRNIKQIADELGFTRDTMDALEHILNVKYAKALQACCEKLGMSVGVYDWPEMQNGPEITKVRTTIRAVKPKIFLSIHFDATDDPKIPGARARTLRLQGSARGGHVMRMPGDKNSESLCVKVAKAITDARIERGFSIDKLSRKYDARETAQSTINEAQQNGCKAIYIETGYYDNYEDLSWCAKRDNMYAMCEKIAQCIKEELI